MKPKKPNRTQTEKTKKNRAKLEKPSQNRAKLKNRVKPVWTGFCPKKPNQTKLKLVGLNRFRFFFLILVWLLLFFFYENRTEMKMITPNI